MKKLLLTLGLGIITAFSWGQNAIVGPDFSTGWGGVCGTNTDFNYLSAMAGSSYGKIIQANGVSGTKYLRFGIDWSGTYKQLTIASGSDISVNFETVYALDLNCTTSGAIKFNVTNTSYYYVFKTRDAGTSPTGNFIIFEVQGTIRTVTSVSTVPYASPDVDQSITCTLDGNLSAGQGVYLRYTNDGWTTSSVVEMTGTGSDYMATIPATTNTAGSTVYYYVFTSGDGLTISGEDADFYTINYNTNGGSNYSYPVMNDTCGGGTVTYSAADTWTSGTPDKTKIAVIDYDLTISGGEDLRVCKLVVNSGKTLTIESGKTVRVLNDIVNNGTIIVEDRGTLIQDNDAAANSGTGTYIVKRQTREYVEYDYTYWASPVAGQDITTAFVTNSQLTMGSGSNGSPSGYIYYFDTANYNDDDNDGYDDEINEWVPATGNMVAGKGLIALGAGSDIPFNYSDLETGFKQLITFSGASVYNGTQTYNLVLDNSSTDNDYNDNLIGNPYPSSLDARQLYEQNTPYINPTMRFWSHDTQITPGVGTPYAYVFSNNDFATYNALSNVGTAAHVSSVTPNQYIASCQGFFVEAKQAGTLTFKNNMRKYDDNASGYGDGHNSNFFRRTDVSSPDVLWLNLTATDGLFRQIAITFKEEAQDTYDAYDSNILHSIGEAEFYSMPVDTSNKLVIQGLNSFEVNKTIPIGFFVSATGTYSISLDHTNGVFSSGQNVYLEDTYQNLTHNLSENPYTFYSETGSNINDRFILRFTTETLDINPVALQNLTLYPNPSTGVVYVNYSGTEKLAIEVFDLLGKRILALADTRVIDLSACHAGIYLVKCSTLTGSITRKIVKE